MEIEFEQQDKKSIKIIGIQDFQRKVIGEIFTPSGSGHTNLNAIQVCGFREAFDLWGCSIFEHIKDEDAKRRIIDGLKGKEDKYIQAKDIQLLFSFNTRTSKPKYGKEECICCYNYPCTCENKGNHTDINPYNLKREGDLPIQHKNELQKEMQNL